MIVALYIFAALVVVGFVLWLVERRWRHVHADDPVEDTPAADAPADGEGECCGMHITCERDSLLAAVSDKIEYFDDEELDACAGRDPGDYTPAEVEAFRDVLLTLLPDDIAPWARSLQLRGINLPPDVRDELLMIVSEQRTLRHGTTV